MFDYHNILFFSNPSLAICLTLILIAINLLRDKIGNKLTVGITLFLLVILLFGLDGLIEMIMSAISGGLIVDHIRSSVNKELKELIGGGENDRNNK